MVSPYVILINPAYFDRKLYQKQEQNRIYKVFMYIPEIPRIIDFCIKIG